MDHREPPDVAGFHTTSDLIEPLEASLRPLLRHPTDHSLSSDLIEPLETYLRALLQQPTFFHTASDLIEPLEASLGARLQQPTGSRTKGQYNSLAFSGRQEVESCCGTAGGEEPVADAADDA